MTTRYTQQEIRFIKTHYPSKGSKYCSDHLKRTGDSIRHKAKHLGIKSNNTPEIIQPNNPQSFDEYNVNPQAFISNFTKESSYLLGLLWADGNLCHDRTIRIEITKEDHDMFLPIFQKTGNWKTYYRNRPNRKPQGIIQTSNKPIYDFLESHNYGPHNIKSACSIISSIPKHLQKYWHMGLIDGDGCWYIRPKKSYQFALSASHNQDWTFFTNMLDSLNIAHSIYRKTHTKNKYSVVRITRKSDIIILGDFIYSDFAKNKIGLPRKYHKYQEIKKYL